MQRFQINVENKLFFNESTAPKGGKKRRLRPLKKRGPFDALHSKGGLRAVASLSRSGVVSASSTPLLYTPAINDSLPASPLYR